MDHLTHRDITADMMIFYIRRMIIFIFLFFQILKSIEAKTDQTLQRHFHDHHLTQLSFPSACDAISKYLDFSSATDMDFQIIESKSDLDTCMHALRSPLTCLERHHVSNDVSHLSSQDRQRKVRIINFIRGGRSDIGDTSDTPFLKRAFQQSNAHIYGVSYVQAQLAKKLVPIRDFRRHLQASIDSPEHIPGSKYDNLSDENLYLIYNRYINLLRDHYLHKMKSYRDRDPRAVRRRCAAILGKCQQDMKDAILPQFKDIWSYEVCFVDEHLHTELN